MLKKPITYVDYEGVEQTDNFYFNLTKIEIINLDARYRNGLIKTVEHALEHNDQATILTVFEDVIQTAYGEKSIDGKQFLKSKEVKEKLVYSPAYDVLVMEMLDGNKASEFISAIIPNEAK